MAEVTIIGKLLDKPEERDAIHVAVAPVIAGEQLWPGQHIGFVTDDTETVGVGAEKLGIVDPFLPHRVERGERFWMFLYQHTITSLKHQWTHPAFGAAASVVKPAADKEASERWLRDFIESANCPDYETVIAAASGNHQKNYGEDGYLSSDLDGDYLHFGGRDAHGEIPSEFWDHVEVVTGKKIESRAAYFSCSC